MKWKGGHTGRDKPGKGGGRKRAGTSVCNCLYTQNAGPFLIVRLKLDLPFHNLLALKEKYQPLVGGWRKSILTKFCRSSKYFLTRVGPQI